MSVRYSLVLTAVLVASAANAQDKTDCDNYGWWGWRGAPRNHACEVRELTLPSGGTLTVDAGRNGGISVTGEDRRDVQVRATVHAWGRDEAEAERIASEITVRSDGVLRAEGPDNEGRTGWSVSFEVRVPRETDLSLETQNGGISLADVRGNVEFEAMNGGVTLNGVAGNVRGQTTNGGVAARLTGDTWDGAGLDVKTTNGGVVLRIPDEYSARLETGTVHGGIDIDFPVTLQGRIGREFATTLGRGGPLVRVTTTNGGVRVARIPAGLQRLQ
jgi:hypothetical protein